MAMRHTAALAGVFFVAAGGSAAAAPTPVLSPYVDLADAGPAPMVGKVVRGYPGAWSGAPTGFSYLWERCQGPVCAPIPGGTVDTYVPSAGDVGYGLRLTVTALHPSEPGRATSAISPQVTAPPAPVPVPSPSSTPATTPTATVGQTITVNGSNESLAPTGAPTASPTRAATSRSATFVRLIDVRREAGYGMPFRVAGDAGPGGAGHTVTLIDSSGSSVGTAVAAADGSFEVAGVGLRPGVWTVRVDDAAATFPLRVRPTAHVARATSRVRRPGVVSVEGRIQPAVEGKIVELQYLDPHRGWRGWRKTQTGPGGTFQVARTMKPNPAVRPFHLRVRVAIPVDVGWIFAPAVSSAHVVRVL